MSSKWHHNFPKIAREAGFTIRELSIGHCIDWRFVASIDPYAIVSECDYEKLDEFIPHISEVPIGTVLNNRILDPAIGKYFILAQFSIQYLLFCKQFLDETVVEIRNTIQALQSENGRLEKLMKKRSDENALLQRKLQRAEELQNHQQTTVYPCSRCTKNFISPELLSAHILRKHVSARPPEAPVDHNPSDTDKSLINTIKLELEVKQLKERLNAAEKDLHGRRSAKGHRCRVCSDESSTVTPQQQQEDAPRRPKILHSIGIQSNLTDDKDCNEKEVQTQTEGHLSRNLSPSSPVELVGKEVPNEQMISKADLQCFLEEQKQLYEFWKANERQNIHQEIEAVKKNLVDAIQTIERSERTTPLPMADESVWKERYQELEKMYEGSQKQARETMVTFEEAYTQKMEQLEKLLLKTHETDEGGKGVPLIRTKNVTSNQGQSATLKLVTLPEITIEGAVGPAGIENFDHTEKDKRSYSSETETTESDTEVVPFESSKDLHITKHPNDTADATHQEPQNALTQSYTAKTLLLSPKKQILNQFRSRLKAIGIDPKAKQLTVDGFNVAGEALAQQRDVQKKKHKHFFITRNQLLSKVEQLARAKVGENSTPVTNAPPSKVQPNVIPKASKPTTRVRSSPTVELLPLKQNLQTSETTGNLSTDMSMFRTKSSITTSVPTARPLIKLAGDDVITVHAEITPVTVSRPAPHSPVPPKRSSISTSDQHVERLLDTPIKTLNTLALTATNRHDAVEKTSDISEILETVPFQPKPIPKKRVLFNLDRVDGTAAVGSSISKEQPAKPKSDHLIALSEGPQQRAKVDDDSDWNISSFDDDK
ncbi:cilium assembly protein DZIP1L [Anopheles bellator]|uniref:cilium assembly protein DZIP1L n=1 Tax=Anopheles bellator TaxID=139047 RepID=UPI002648261F|nr:cilium assembly protein DZIP1L [Anopheles bellator]